MFKKFITAILIAILFVFLIPFAISIYLSPQDNLEKCDAIIVISGGDTEARVQEGVSLFKDGWAQTIIFSGAAATGDVSNALAMKKGAILDGIPDESILIEEESKTTKENAEYVTEIIKEESIDSVILITSPYHQRRAYNNFRAELGDDFKIINHSAKDQDWSKKGWWENANARILTLKEIVKNFYLIVIKE
jgi:uncharacterized SAM-binding protein YcdF (DUF218 family)